MMMNYLTWVSWLALVGALLYISCPSCICESLVEVKVVVLVPILQIHHRFWGNRAKQCKRVVIWPVISNMEDGP